LTWRGAIACVGASTEPLEGFSGVFRSDSVLVLLETTPLVRRLRRLGGIADGLPERGGGDNGNAAFFPPVFSYVYATSQYADPEIWQAPVSGGVETQVSPLIHPATWASWLVVDRGILFAGSSGKRPPIISLFDFATRHVTAVGTLRIAPFWLGGTRDGKTVVFDQPGSEQDQVMLVDNFR
jgi:hypothetical protein